MTTLETDANLRHWLANLELAHLTESFVAAGWRDEKLLDLTREELVDLGVPKDQRGAAFVAANPAGKLVSTPWLKTLKALVNWRNETLGHGAFHLDPQEYLPDLEQWLSAINRHLAEQVAQGLWADVGLRGEVGTPPLTGWRAIRHWHDGEAGTHRETEAPLVLERAGRALRLTPLVALRRCAVCAKQDVFLYDTRSGCDQGSGFILLDYLSGQTTRRPVRMT